MVTMGSAITKFMGGPNMLSPYIVKFFKKVVAHGHEEQACQFAFETFAFDKADAAEIAKREFCEAHHLVHWRLHADRVQVSEADFPS